MLEAAFWGSAAASSLVVGALLAFAFRVSQRAQGLVLAFGAGVLICSVAFELVEDALDAAAPTPLLAAGFALGALTFYAGSVALARWSGAGDGSGDAPTGRLDSRRASRDKGAAIVLGAILDGIPESVVLGLSLLFGGINVPMLAAVFISNVPEALGASEDLEAGGLSRSRTILLWVTVVIASGVAAAIGYAALQDAPREVVSSVQLFAAGAIIAMLAESMIPEAYEKGGRAVGLATAFGFATATLLSFAT
jgi:ZIP family zinc transporter